MRLLLLLFYWRHWKLKTNKPNKQNKSANNLFCWHVFRHSTANLAETWYDGIYYWALRFDTSLFDHEFVSRSLECDKAKTFAPIVSQCEAFIAFGWNLVCCWLWMVDETRIHFIFCNQDSKERIQLGWFCNFFSSLLFLVLLLFLLLLEIG